MECCDYNEKLYISTSFDRVDSPWAIDIRTGRLGYIDFTNKTYLYKSFQCVSERNMSDYLDVIEKNGRLFFLPARFCSDARFCTLSLHEMKKEEIKLKDFFIRKDFEDQLCFTGMILVDQYLFFIPYSYPAIVRIDTRDLSVKYIGKWKEILDEKRLTDSQFGYFIARQYVIKNGFLYIPFLAVSAILKINLETLEEYIVFVDTNPQGFSCICNWDSERVLLSGAGQKKDWIYLWNEKNNMIEQEWYVQETPGDYPVIKMLMSNDGNVFIFPWQNWKHLNVDVYRLNCQNMEIKNIGLLSLYTDAKKEQVLWGDEIIYAHWIDDNRILFITGRDFKWHEYNVHSYEHIEYDVLFDKTNENAENVLKEFCCVMAEHKKVIREETMGMNTFVHLIGS